MHVTGGDCVEQDAALVLLEHFKHFGSPVMIGRWLDVLFLLLKTPQLKSMAILQYTSDILKKCLSSYPIGMDSV